MESRRWMCTRGEMGMGKGVEPEKKTRNMEMKVHVKAKLGTDRGAGIDAEMGVNTTTWGRYAHGEGYPQ